MLEEKPTTTEKPKPIPTEEIAVVCYELGPFVPDSGKPPEATLMRPNPLERVRGRWGRLETKNAARDQLEAAGHKVHTINFGKTPQGERALLVNIWGKRAAPKAPSKPVIPPPRPRRSATSRRHAQRPESRKKP